MRKFLFSLLTFCLLIPFIISCTDAPPASVPVYIDGYEFVVSIGSKEFKATQINSSPENENIVIYTRDYRINGEYSFTVANSQEGRTALSVRRVNNGDEFEFDVVQMTDDVSSAVIPVNGFVITIPSAQLKDVRVNVGQIVKVTGYENAVQDFENLELASFAPSGMTFTASRRINMIDPINAFVENKIYYISDKFKENKAIALDNITALVEKVSSYSYEIKEVGKATEIGVPSKNQAILVFTGEYNIAYAKKYLITGEKIMVNMLDKANKYSDIPAVIKDEEVISFEPAFINVDSFHSDGAYLFDIDYTVAATPGTVKKRVDVVVVNDFVVNIAEVGARTLVPSGNGYVLSLIGDEAINRFSGVSVGDNLESCFIEYNELPEKFVEINGHIFGIDKINSVRQPEGAIILYNDSYGQTTGSNEYGTEIAIKDGKVIAINRLSGNIEIPTDGYVLSVHKDSDSIDFANKAEVGDEVEISLVGNDYSVSELNVTDYNSTRVEDSLIIYHSMSNSGTNEYGYEIAVDENGIAIDAGHNGNMKIPTNGFVVSGHGVNKTALEDIYLYGERIILNKTQNKLIIIKTPELKIGAAANEIAVMSDKFEEAKKAFLNIDYSSVGDKLEMMSALIAEAETAMKEFNFEKSLALCDTVIQNCNTLVYDLIETKGVENRMMWYRATEKSDDEVRQTVEKMKLFNINAVYIETWYEGYCIGDKVDIPGINTSRNSGYDVLDGFVRICHENNIEVHAWVQNFFVGFYYKDGASLYNPVFDSYKDKYLIDCKGRTEFYYSSNNNYFIFLNPNDRECRDLILNIYEEILTKYEVDGLHIDYVRMPELNYGTDDFGYNQDIIDAFAKKTGITGDPRAFAENSKEAEAWINFRCDIITSFVKEVYDLVNAQDRDIWFSAATYPDIPHSKKTIFQDIVTFVDNGYFDEIFSMSYGADNGYVISNVKSYVLVTNDKCFYSGGIQAFSDTTPINFAYQLSDVELAGADGVAVFALNYINADNYQPGIVSGAFRTPSVQTYKLSVSASAQMNYICEKLDNMSPIFENIDSDDIEYIKQRCGEIKSFADDFNLQEATSSQKIKWCSDTIVLLGEFKSDIIKRCGDNAEAKAIIEDVEDLEYWLTLSKQRLEIKK